MIFYTDSLLLKPLYSGAIRGLASLLLRGLRLDSAQNIYHLIDSPIPGTTYVINQLSGHRQILSLAELVLRHQRQFSYMLKIAAAIIFLVVAAAVFYFHINGIPSLRYT